MEHNSHRQLKLVQVVIVHTRSLAPGVMPSSWFFSRVGKVSPSPER